VCQVRGIHVLDATAEEEACSTGAVQVGVGPLGTLHGLTLTTLPGVSPASIQVLTRHTLCLPSFSFYFRTLATFSWPAPSRFQHVPFFCCITSLGPTMSSCPASIGVPASDLVCCHASLQLAALWPRPPCLASLRVPAFCTPFFPRFQPQPPVMPTHIIYCTLGQHFHSQFHIRLSLWFCSSPVPASGFGRGVCRCISTSFPLLQRLLWAVDFPDVHIDR
jgi:hypothetical protein